MRKMPELSVFIRHYDWYTKDDTDNFFIPTAKAPPEAVKASKRYNYAKYCE